MKIQLTYKIFILFIFTYNATNAQQMLYLKYLGNGSYDTVASVFPANLVASDFGPRKYDDNWHGGVDFNGPGEDKWDMILAPESGTIIDDNHVFKNTRNNIRYIGLDAGDHRYLFVHMFDNNNSYPKWMNNNTIFLTSIIDNPMRWALVFIVNGSTYTLGQVAGKINYNGQMINVSNQINQYEPVGLLGDSGTNGPHLHLNTIPDDKKTYSDVWNKNPLQYIEHTQPSYTLSIYNQNNTTLLTPLYPGDRSMKLKVRPTMNGQQTNSGRYSLINDIDKVEIKIKKEAAVWTNIIGGSKDSKITLGGKIDGITQNHIIGKFGSWSSQGIYPYMYTGLTDRKSVV